MNKHHQVILITGGSAGIGKATGVYLQDLGFKVVGTSRNPNTYPDHPFPLFAMDLKDSDSIKQAVNNVMDVYARIDVLINNAGMGIAGPLEELPRDAMQLLFETNVLGPIVAIQEVIPIMRKQGEGRIINISSIAGYSGLPFRSVYSATKGSIELITESLRIELKGSGILCTTLAPGDIATDMASARYNAAVVEGSPYEKKYGQARQDMDAHVSSGMKPEKVAKKIAQLLLKKSLNVHYRVGPVLQRSSIYLKSILPDRWYEFILTKFYNL